MVSKSVLDLDSGGDNTDLQVMQPVRTFLLPLRPEGLGGD